MNMTWNYRIVDVSPQLGTQEPVYEVCEVHYENGVPEGYSEPFTHADTPQELLRVFDKMVADIKANPEPLTFTLEQQPDYPG